MTDLPVSSPLSSFTSYRRNLALASITEELQRRASVPAPAAPPVSGRAEPGAVLVDLHRLIDSPDPLSVFTHLAELLIPTLCDEATVDVHVGAEVFAWQQLSQVTADLPGSQAHPDGTGWVLTVNTPAHSTGFDGDDPGPDYLAVLTCRWGTRNPTGQEVALIELASHHAATVVHQSRQLQLLHEEQDRVEHLLAALESNRMISAAVGVLIATHRLSYEQAFDLLIRTSQATNRKLATVAEAVLQNAFSQVDR